MVHFEPAMLSMTRQIYLTAVHVVNKLFSRPFNRFSGVFTAKDLQSLSRLKSGKICREDFKSFSMDILRQIEQFLADSREKNTSPLIVVLGPTASGKSALSLKIANLFGGEIINADSRQIYKSMDIGTDKFSVLKQEGTPHYLYDIVSPDEDFTVVDYMRMAIKTINEIYGRRKIPILCGGTGLYISAVIENYQIPPVPPKSEFRQQYEEYAVQKGPEALHKLLAEKDPQTAARIHPNNVRYVIRALEINDLGGMEKQDRRGAPLFDTFILGIEWDREQLYERINQRVDELVARGLVNEVKTLLMKGYSEKLSSMSSLGYPEIIAYIKGEMSLDQSVEEIKKNTRNYAKRQMTWFRRYRNVHWISSPEVRNLDHRQDSHIEV
jgi:tRNA dimethylallyltransferase